MKIDIWVQRILTSHSESIPASGDYQLFCDKCGTLLSTKKEENGTNRLFCASCGWTPDPEKHDLTLPRTISHIMDKEKTTIIENIEEVQSMPLVSQECPKCENNKATYWQLQTRRSDEGATTFYRCTKCSHTWREY